MMEKILDRMPMRIVTRLNSYKRQYERQEADSIDRDVIREGVMGYLSGLRDAEVITDKERQELYIHTVL